MPSAETRGFFAIHREKTNLRYVIKRMSKGATNGLNCAIGDKWVTKFSRKGNASVKEENGTARAGEKWLKSLPI
jgi:hypothetical protein